jgi:hypothetical protein
MVESLMTAPRPVPTPEAVSDAYLQALAHFQERQSFVDAHMIQEPESAAYAHNHLALANRELGLNIGAALALGDMDYLETDIEWVAGLLENHQLPVDALYGYLHAYRKTVVEQLDERDRPVVAWLSKVLDAYVPG